MGAINKIQFLNINGKGKHNFYHLVKKVCHNYCPLYLMEIINFHCKIFLKSVCWWYKTKVKVTTTFCSYTILMLNFFSSWLSTLVRYVTNSFNSVVLFFHFNTESDLTLSISHNVCPIAKHRIMIIWTVRKFQHDITILEPNATKKM